MKIIEDLHLHTHISKDSKQNPEEYVKEAIKRRIKYLGFSDHLDLDPTDKDYGYYNYENAYTDYIALKKKYGKQLNLLFGTEVTYQSTLKDTVVSSTINKPYDYMIGSVHRLEGFTIAGVRGLPFFEGKNEFTAYMAYFEEMAKLVDLNYFQIIGHFDVIKRFGVQFYGKFNAKKYEGIIRSILKVLVKQKNVLELNSSGFRQKPMEPYPSKEILEIYAEEGGVEITIGSDAHSIKQFGNGLEETLKYAKSIFDFELIAFVQKKRVKLGKISDFL